MTRLVSKIVVYSTSVVVFVTDCCWPQSDIDLTLVNACPIYAIENESILASRSENILTGLF